METPRQYALPFALALLGAAAGAALAAGSQKQKPPAPVPSPISPVRPQRPPAALPTPTVAPDPGRLRHLLPPSEYVPVSQLRAGMKGYGLSVFHGTQIEKFDVTILGVMRKVNNGRDLILVKLGGPNLKRVTDIIAGMSGSPVYVNGKIIGAVAYGSEFTKESMGYVTPIEDMLDAWDPALPQSPGLTDSETKPASASLTKPFTIDGKTYTRVAVIRPGKTLSPGTLGLRQLGTKVTVSGVSGPRFTRIAGELAKWGLDARRGGGAAATPGLKGSPLTPGGAIAMSLATGDIDITGIGTLTYRRGSQVVAFGHPFLGIGPIDAPMFTAYIHDIEPSYAESHKIGSPVSLVGAFSQDRPFSIGGKVGAKPALIPISVRVTDRAFGRDREFEAKIVRHPQLTPVLATMAAGTAIAEVHGQPGDTMATVTTEVVADEVGTIRRTNRVFDAAAIDDAAIGDLRSLLGLLSGNPFYPLGIRSVKMQVTIESGRRTAQVERIFLKQSRFEPGDTVEVGVVLKPYKKDRIYKTLSVRIPTSAPTGTLLLSVQGGGSGSGGGISIGGISLSRPGGGVDSSTAATVQQLVHRFEERDRNDEIVAKLLLPTAAVSVRGEKLSDLPPNIDAAIRSGGSRTSGIRIERDEVKVIEPTDYVVSGGQILPIRVYRKGAQPLDRPNGMISPSVTITPGGQGAPNPGAPGSSGVSPFGSPGGNSTPIPNDPNDPENDPEAEAILSGAGISPRSVMTLPVVIAPPPAPPQPITLSARPPSADEDDDTGNGRPIGNPASAASSSGFKAVGRMPGVWRQSAATDFRAGTLDGVTVTSQGEIRLAPKLTKVAESADPYFWCLAPDGAEGVFAGSGDNGVVYRVSTDGKRSLFAETGELEVHALARATNGTLYAGTSPHGKVFSIGADGKPTLLFTAKEKYILALTLDQKNNTLYAAVGGPKAKVYAIPLADGADNKPKAVYESDEGSVTALALGPNGSLYAGTAPNGLIVQVTGLGLTKATVLYDAAEPSVSGLAVSKEGTVYAACAPRGAVYRLKTGETPRVVFDRAPTGILSGLALTPDGTLYTASGATVIALRPEESGSESLHTFDAPSDIQILSLLRTDDGRIWASTGNVGGVYCLGAGSGPEATKAEKGEFTSTIFDAKATARWGSLRWSADTPVKASLYLQTRSGETAEPDATWSDWSRAYGSAAGEKIVSPPGRYLQYRVQLAGTSAIDTPVLHSVEAFYLTPNQAPQVALVSPRGGEVWSGRKAIRWGGMDPDKDTLTYEVSVSPDGGKTWQQLPAPGANTAANIVPDKAPRRKPIAAPVVPEEGAISASPVQAESERKMLAGIETELDRHPEISPEMRQRILADAPRQLREAVNGDGSGDNAPPPSYSAGPTSQTSRFFDTTRFPDGIYRLRVTATDRPSNPDGALTTERVSGEFRIVNHAPLLTLMDKSLTIQTDRTARLEGVAMHPSAAIRAVQFRVDGGDWTAATAKDGIFDGLLESFTLTTLPLGLGPHTIEVQTQDEAGNVATQKTTVTVR